MKPAPILLCVFVAASLAACSAKPPEPQAKPAADVATPFDTLKANKQRAKDVGDMVEKQAAEQRKQLEAQEQ